MQRWVLTTSLAAGALVALWLAPRLGGGAAPVASDPPVADGPLSVAARLDEAVLLHGDDASRWLVVDLSAPDEPGASRVPADVALVVDVSGSMGEDGRIENARIAADTLVDALRDGDRFALVAFDDRARVLADGPFDPARREALHAVVGGLEPGGGTNIWDGLDRAHGVLGDGALQRRVILVSDGRANQGVTEPEAFRALAERWRGEGLIVSALGLGEGFNEVLLEGLADAGGGNYAFVASADELPAVMGREVEAAARTVARDVVVDVAVPPGVTAVDVPGWSWTATPDGVRVRAGSLAAGERRKIVVEVKPDTDALGPTHVADVRVGYTLVTDASGRGAAVSVDAGVTDDAAEAHASADPAAKAQVARARAGTMQQHVAELYRAGRRDEARQLTAASQGILRTVATDYAIPELDAEAADLQALGYLDDNMAAKSASAKGRGMGR